MSLSKRELALFGLLIVIVGMYLLYHNVFNPLNLHITQMKAENSTLNKELQALESKIAQQGDIWLEKQQMWDKYDKMLLKVPRSPMIPNIIDFMERSAREAGIKLLSISYKESPVAKKTLEAQKSEASITEGNIDSLRDKSDQDGEVIIENLVLENYGDGGSMAQAVNFQLTASGTHLNLLSFLLKIENAQRIYRINSIKMIMVRNNQQKVGSDIEASIQEANSGKKEDFIDVAVKESQAYDITHAEVNVDFTAFFDRVEASGISTETSIGKDYKSIYNNECGF
ncbi:MAG: hypothetical protein PHZ03_07360 [Syntrophomonas sp.]|nr:hypothetical protein [Syntrophomonas sp.]